MGQRTALYDCHLNAGAKIVDFGGWDMPIHYGSQLEEHHAVRRQVGMFDVSHMTILDVQGTQAEPFLRQLLANDVAKLKTTGKALYTAMLNEDGGVIDDLIVYRMAQGYRLILNCATREQDLNWITRQGEHFDVQFEEQAGLGILAIQGPESMAALQRWLTTEQWDLLAGLRPFYGVALGDWWVAKTGYTGEDGVEMLVPNDELEACWQGLLEAGVKPCGLGARDTLRLEAGMNLYGSDMDQAVSPLAAGMGWTVAWNPQEREFLGRTALAKELESAHRQQQVGLVLEQGRAVLRAHQSVFAGEKSVGEITSGSFSPTLECSVALARIESGIDDNEEALQVEIRGKRFPVRVVAPPFVRQGKKQFD